MLLSRSRCWPAGGLVLAAEGSSSQRTCIWLAVGTLHWRSSTKEKTGSRGRHQPSAWLPMTATPPSSGSTTKRMASSRAQGRQLRSSLPPAPGPCAAAGQGAVGLKAGGLGRHVEALHIRRSPHSPSCYRHPAEALCPPATHWARGTQYLAQDCAKDEGGDEEQGDLDAVDGAHDKAQRRALGRVGRGVEQAQRRAVGGWSSAASPSVCKPG